MHSQKIQFLYTDESYAPEIMYLCRLLGSIMQLELIPNHISRRNRAIPYSIGYCRRDQEAQLPETCRIRIHTDDNFWKHYLDKRYPPVQKREQDGLVALNTNETDTFLIRNGTGITTNLDLLTSAFFMITGMEEIFNPHPRDKHGRIKFSQHRWAHLYVDNPLINVYADKLRYWFGEVYPLSVPSSSGFTAVLTHDIDSPFYYGTLRTEASNLFNSIKSGGKYANLRELKHYLAFLLGMHRDPHDTFAYIQERESNRGIAATYFVMLSKDNAWGLDRRKYSCTLERIQTAGNEIALHPGYASYDDPKLIAREKQSLEVLAGATITGSRNHFLQFKMPDTFRRLSSLGFTYDSTLGFHDREGFRCGICTPYKPYDVHFREEIDIIEVPLVVMDGTLRQNRRQSPGEALGTIENLIRRVSSCAGVITLNWHNSFLGECKREWRDVYEQSLEMLVNHGAQFMTCNTVASLWRDSRSS